jgi:hypothetical protein
VHDFVTLEIEQAINKIEASLKSGIDIDVDPNFSLDQNVLKVYNSGLAE